MRAAALAASSYLGFAIRPGSATIKNDFPQQFIGRHTAFNAEMKK